MQRDGRVAGVEDHPLEADPPLGAVQAGKVDGRAIEPERVGAGAAVDANRAAGRVKDEYVIASIAIDETKIGALDQNVIVADRPGDRPDIAAVGDDVDDVL